MNQQIPNSGQPTVQAHIKTKSFISKSSSPSDLEKFDKELSAFLATIDNRNRFLNGRNSYSIGEKVYALVWYLEKIEETPVTTPFGKQNVKPDTSEKKSD